MQTAAAWKQTVSSSLRALHCPTNPVQWLRFTINVGTEDERKEYLASTRSSGPHCAEPTECETASGATSAEASDLLFQCADLAHYGLSSRPPAHVSAALQRIAEETFWRVFATGRPQEVWLSSQSARAASPPHALLHGASSVRDGDAVLACFADTADDDWLQQWTVLVCGDERHSGVTARQFKLLKDSIYEQATDELTGHFTQLALLRSSEHVSYDSLCYLNRRHVAAAQSSIRHQLSPLAALIRLSAEQARGSTTRSSLGALKPAEQRFLWQSPRAAESLLRGQLMAYRERHGEKAMQRRAFVSGVTAGLTDDCGLHFVAASLRSLAGYDATQEEPTRGCFVLTGGPPALDALAGSTPLLRLVVSCVFHSAFAPEKSLACCEGELLAALRALRATLRAQEAAVLAKGSPLWFPPLDDEEALVGLSFGSSASRMHTGLLDEVLLDDTLLPEDFSRKEAVVRRTRTDGKERACAGAMPLFLPMPSTGLDGRGLLSESLRACDILCAALGAGSEACGSAPGAEAFESLPSCDSGEVRERPRVTLREAVETRHRVRVAVARRYMHRTPQAMWRTSASTDERVHDYDCDNMIKLRAFPFVEALTRSLDERCGSQRRVTHYLLSVVEGQPGHFPSPASLAKLGEIAALAYVLPHRTPRVVRADMQQVRELKASESAQVRLHCRYAVSAESAENDGWSASVCVVLPTEQAARLTTLCAEPSSSALENPCRTFLLTCASGVCERLLSLRDVTLADLGDD